MRAATIKAQLMAGVSAISCVLLTAGIASAQAAPAVQKVANGTAEVGEVVVTGTHIIRNGYSAPTPVTAIAIELLQASTPSNVPDALNKLPQFSGSSIRTFCCAAATVGNYLNLRSLGAQRTLVLLDGQRVTPTTDNGLVDVNLMPEALIQRVDVVTGGASAAYGSDAVSGVVNYVVDNQFVGWKGLLQGGASTYGDDDTNKFSIAYGTKFADDRGHFVLSAEHFRAGGIKKLSDRPTPRGNYILGGNGSGAAPYNLVSNTTYLTTTFGGLIVNASGLGVATAGAPLAGQRFLPGGGTTAFIPGTAIPGTPVAGVGGDGATNNLMQPEGSLRFDHVYSQLSYEFTPNLNGYIRIFGGESRTTNRYATDNRQSSTAFTIFNDNAFLPAAQSAQLAATGTTSFRLARTNGDFGLLTNNSLNSAFDVRAGLNGSVFDGWKWNASYAHGESILRSKDYNNTVIAREYAAVDAVRDPSGNIVCRVTLTNPGAFPGCVPVNLFGVGSPSKQAIAYFFQPDDHEVRNTQDVASVDLAGDLFTLPAGPVSFALGAELRRRTLVETSNPIALAQINGAGVRGVPGAFCPTVATCRFGGFNQGNYGTANAHDTVKEVFAETVIPLLKDLPFVHSLDFNGAERYADYTASGGINTWKVGLSYEPVESLRIRATKSRDIRAPNLFELYSAPTTAFTPGLIDPLTGTANVLSPTITRGNPNLKPEQGTTYTIGAIYNPAWLPGFSGSIDYYNIEIINGIQPTTAQATLNACAAGDAASCTLISRAPVTNVISSILLQQVNIGRVNRKGYDFDLSYSAPLSEWFKTDASLRLRALATYVDSFTQTVGKTTTEFAGFASAADQTVATPKWKGSVSATFDKGPLSLFLQERYIGPMTQLPNVPNGIFIDPKLHRVFYTDVTAKYSFRQNYELYATINNLFNKQPPVEGNIFAPALGYPTVPLTYDLDGRYYTVGLRFNF